MVSWCLFSFFRFFLQALLIFISTTHGRKKQMRRYGMERERERRRVETISER